MVGNASEMRPRGEVGSPLLGGADLLRELSESDGGVQLPPWSATKQPNWLCAVRVKASIDHVMNVCRHTQQQHTLSVIEECDGTRQPG